MTVAVDISVAKKITPALQQGIVYKNLAALAALYPQHQFVFIADRAFPSSFVFPQNIAAVSAGPAVNSRLAQYFWYNYKLPALLRKHRANIFVGVNGCTSMRTKLPQYLLVSDVFLNNCKPGFLQKQFAAFAGKAAAIIAASGHAKETIASLCPAAKIQVIHPAAGNGFAPITWQQKEAVKEQYAHGREYFLHAGEVNSKARLVNLLKAFSLFKKWQKSNMQLLVAGKIYLPQHELATLLGTYKYREEVQLTGWLPAPEFATLLAGAYALVHTGAGVQAPIEAMACDVPVIAGKMGALPEICGEAALYADVHSPEDLAAQMMLLFKDEDQRSRLIAKGTLQCRQYSPAVVLPLLAAAVLHTGKA
jgi:glycosyltransferase involved in cell wall biosynthesis